jgi:hypothetical protein
MFHNSVCFAAQALVSSDGFHQVGRPSIMQEEDALANAPKGSGAELVGTGAALRDAVGESFAPVVDEEVRETIPPKLLSAIPRSIIRMIILVLPSPLQKRSDTTAHDGYSSAATALRQHGSARRAADQFLPI